MAPMKRWVQVALFIGFVVMLGVVVLEFFWIQPEAELARAKLETRDYVAQKLALRVATAQALGSLALLLGIFFTWRSLRLTQSNVEIARDALKLNTDTQEANLKAAHHRQMTELLSKAVEQLGHAQLGVRIGGIYILEQVSQESSALEQPIIDILVAYLRHRSPWPAADAQAPAGDREDIQAVASVLTRRMISHVEPALRINLSHLDLSDTDMAGVRLQNVPMEHVNLSRAKLNGAVLVAANLCDAVLDSADLTGAHLRSAHLIGASLKNACCEGADFTGARLDSSDLTNANLQKCNLTRTVFERATMNYAQCWRADFSGAALLGADADSIDLRHAILTTGLHHVNLAGAELSNTELRGLDFRETDLSDADLTGSDLSNANMTGASLIGAKLGSAVLAGADLRHAVLALAVLTGSDLRGTDLRGARGLDSAKVAREQLVEAVLDGETKAQFRID